MRTTKMRPVLGFGFHGKVRLSSPRTDRLSSGVPACGKPRESDKPHLVNRAPSPAATPSASGVGGKIFDVRAWISFVGDPAFDVRGSYSNVRVLESDVFQIDFNVAQLEDIGEAESVLTAARDNPVPMGDQDITAEYLDSYKAIIGEAHARTTAADLTKDQAKTETTEALAAAETLKIALQRIQSSAKQKFKMLAEDGDPDTNFPLDGYLIGTRIAANRATLYQSAVSLIRHPPGTTSPASRPRRKSPPSRTCWISTKPPRTPSRKAPSRKKPPASPATSSSTPSTPAAPPSSTPPTPSGPTPMK